MHKPVAFRPPDQPERNRALDPTRSFLVQAPAGSGKTYLLTQRFLRLLAEAQKPEEIVAITFTNAAAAEMRNRVLEALEKAETQPGEAAADLDSLPALAAKALEQAKIMGWQILDQPSQLRITTIDAFCRGLALQSPLSWGMLSGLGGTLDTIEEPKELYRRAARRTLDLLQTADSPARQSVETVLLWRDNNWKDVEDLIVEMLAGRNRWYQEFVFARDRDWEALRRRLEAPFRRSVRASLTSLCKLLSRLPESGDFALELARGACKNAGKFSPLRLAERAELPVSFDVEEEETGILALEDAQEAYADLAGFLLNKEGEWRKPGGLNVHYGFPAGATGKAAKERFGAFVDGLDEEPGLRETLASFLTPTPVRYTETEWELIRHCFTVLREAAGQLQVVFAETGSVDFTEIAQIALRILAPENGFPSDFALRQADGIRHLLVDEFQDTSRSQHQLLARLIAAWPEREGRTCFCVGDPMQSIYGFREAEVELFERLKTHGLETSTDPLEEPFRFDFVSLRANFRTVASLVNDLNSHFEQIFAENDGSGVQFSPAIAARDSQSQARVELHLAFTESRRAGSTDGPPPVESTWSAEPTRKAQLQEMVALIRSKLDAMPVAAEKYRIAVLGRTRSSLVRIAEALREAGIQFRAIDLVPLRERPEVLDALALARALLNPTDRTAWLGVLRAPWCGLTLTDLHVLTSGDDAEIGDTPVPALLGSRLQHLFAEGKLSARAFEFASRVGRVLLNAVALRPSASATALGTWLESVWKALGGTDTVNAEQRENLQLLWSALDKLPDSEMSLLEPGLNAALDRLFAQPEPSASSDFGIQLMTIHKSKGLEFEVVIVPDLEAEGQKSERTMISWLERGLSNFDHGLSNSDSHLVPYDLQLTEFLIAPIQAKGTEAGVAKRWVDRVKRARELQEMRRLLYVAATRAREELHWFARPKFRIDSKSGEFLLASPAGLLATAWPAVSDEVEAQFAAWPASMAAAPEFSELLTLAANAPDRMSNVVEMPKPRQPKPTMLRRLPEPYTAPEFSLLSAGRPGRDGAVAESQALYSRTEGGLHSRLLGTAIHKLLERLSKLRRSLGPAEAGEALLRAMPAVVAEMRGHGLPRPAAEHLAAEALAAAQQASAHPLGAWILTPHPHAQAEAQWTGFGPASGVRERPWNLRPDRVFFAPPWNEPEEELDIEPVWWIIDYKTPKASFADEAEKLAFLRNHKEQFAGQLAAYAQVLRSLREEKDGAIRIRAGIFYPRLLLLDSWDA